MSSFNSELYAWADDEIPSSSTITAMPKACKRKEITAVIIARNSSNFVLMFTSDKIGIQFFMLSSVSLDTPVVGKWYTVSIPKKQIANSAVLEVPKLQALETRIFYDKPPIQTRISNGAVQFLTDVILGDSSRQGLLVHSKQFEKIIDSMCLLKHLEEDLSLIQIPIRNAPRKRVPIWIAPRKYFVCDICWKVVSVETKYRKKKPKFELTLAGGEFNTPLIHIRNNKFREPILDNPMLSKEVIDGLVCSQTASNFIVYSPKYRWIAYLDRQKTHENILGMWIQFQIPSGNNSKTVENFWTINPKIQAIPTHEYVMFKSKIEVPRLLESSENIWCNEMGLVVVDCHALLRRGHQGILVNATIGCASQILESEANTDKVVWEILHVDDQ